MFGFPPLDYSLHIVQLTCFGFSAGRLVQNHRQNIMKLCVIYGESTPFVRHIGFSVVKKKAAYHSAGSNVRDFWPWRCESFLVIQKLQNRQYKMQGQTVFFPVLSVSFPCFFLLCYFEAMSRNLVNLSFV